ncbi:flagellar assembly protein FliH [Oceanobacillus massiliensis]|uniref:flagellar assembly protein FliH n=1 Tax=Oceanobacillus massiliensis TaxID=1465765 RepID=UPI000289B789|nr:flagellar assembly protein FliH [Oceanobacillus massiliensis]
MSDAENRKFQSQKLIKIRPVELLQKETSEEPAADMERDRDLILQKITDMQQELTELSQRKTALIDQTNQEISQAKQDWDTEKKQWIENAKQEGFTAGFQQGKNVGYDEYKEKLEQANLIIDATTNDYHATIEKSDEIILQLAIGVADKILDQQLTDDSNSFMGIVRRAIQEIKDQSVVTINLHPANYDLVMQHKEELRRSLGNDTKLSVYIDDKLEENACLIEHPFGKIDASIDTQLLKIQEALQDYLMEKRS